MISKDAFRLGWVAALSFGFFIGCASPPTVESDSPAAGIEADRVQEIKDEVAVGKGIAAKLLGSFGHYDRAPDLERYVNRVGRVVAQRAGRPELTFRFAILDTDEVNAFAAPGGYVFLTRGLIKTLRSEDELAGILGHEIAHIDARHMYKDIAVKREVGTGESIARLLSRGGADITGAMNEMVSKGIKMLLEDGYGQEKEAEADAFGVMYAAAAGYDPTALASAVSRIEKDKGHLKLSSTHPPYEARIAALHKALAENGLSRGSSANKDVLARRFKAAVAKIKE